MDMNSFLEHLRPLSILAAIDKANGVTPEQRQKLNDERDKHDRYIERIATQAADKLSPKEWSALQEYFTRDM